jgi:hypothetical protein
MKMDRNINTDGSGKYAVINMRKLRELRDDNQQFPPEVVAALHTLADCGALEWGAAGADDEFFLIKLKDRHARAALLAYERSIEPSDPEFALEVAELAARAGKLSPFCKEPD